MAAGERELLLQEPWYERKAALYAGRAIIVVAIFLAWEALVLAGWLNPGKTGRPGDIWTAFLGTLGSGQLWKHLKVTLYEEFVGFVIGVGGGTAIGLGLRWSPRED